MWSNNSFLHFKDAKNHTHTHTHTDTVIRTIKKDLQLNPGCQTEAQYRPCIRNQTFSFLRKDQYHYSNLGIVLQYFPLLGCRGRGIVAALMNITSHGELGWKMEACKNTSSAVWMRRLKKQRGGITELCDRPRPVPLLDNEEVIMGLRKACLLYCIA